jgi:hypothetical protein
MQVLTLAEPLWTLSSIEMKDHNDYSLLPVTQVTIEPQQLKTMHSVSFQFTHAGEGNGQSCQMPYYMLRSIKKKEHHTHNLISSHQLRAINLSIINRL